MKISIKNVFFYVLIFFLSTYILLEVFVPSKTVDLLGFKSYVIVSQSMEPDIMVNDVIVIRKVKESELDVGDKVSFSVYIPEFGKRSTVTHYIGDIVEVDGESIYKTQGANKDPGDYDEWTDENNDPIEITFNDIEGRVAIVIPKIGHVVNILKDPVSIGLLLINGIIIYLIVKVFKSKELKTNK